jgi:spore maturation protein B
MASTIQGSCDTTLYIVTVYFGAVGVRRVRHAVWVGLLADIVGFIAAVVVCRAVFG